MTRYVSKVTLSILLVYIFIDVACTYNVLALPSFAPEHLHVDVLDIQHYLYYSNISLYLNI